MQSLCICILCLSIAFALGVQSSHIETTKWSGLQFGNRLYPSVEELENISLGDLLAIRPSRIRGAEKKHFEDLFAQHRDISELTPDATPNHEEFVQKWVDLRASTGTEPKAKRLHNAIMSHLKGKLSMSEEVMKEVRQRYHTAQSILERRKRRTSTDADQTKIQLHKDVQRRYYKERRMGLRGRQVGAACFENLMRSNGISTTLPAVEMEKASRHLRDALGDVQRTSLFFRQFLICRDKEEKGIKLAILNRRVYNDGLVRVKANDQQKINKRIRRLEKRKGKSHTDGRTPLPSDAEIQHSTLISARILAQSRW